MGAVFRPKDLGKGYRKVIENAIKDLHPDTKDIVIRLLLSKDIHSFWDRTGLKSY